MLCVVIKGPSFEEAHHQIAQALAYADVVELRLDCFHSLDLTALRRLRAEFPIPMIFTLRSRSQGGNYAGSEQQRLADIQRLATMKPEYIDIEDDICRIASQLPDIRVILSHHDFTGTPEDLEGLYNQMQKTPASFYKIAVTARSSVDALRLLGIAKHSHGNLIAISMGLQGQVTRILGPIVGCPITYASLDDIQQTAPGQLSAKILAERYRHHSLNSGTAVYGLIGDPVDKSISDITHNAFFHAAGLDAVYVKIPLKAEELSPFLQLAKEFPFCGLSVTMPLKESVLPYLDRIDPQAREIGAVNTLVFHQAAITGYNTDSMGALNAIERKMTVKGKRVVIIGAGGAAKAIAFETHRRGGLVTILNRDAEKASRTASRFQGTGKGLDQMETCAEQGYDILINCTPMPMPISPDHIRSDAVVMDINVRPKDTSFSECALSKGCQVVYWHQMFIEQAVGQHSLWFKDRINVDACRTTLESSSEKILNRFG